MGRVGAVEGLVGDVDPGGGDADAGDGPRDGVDEQQAGEGGEALDVHPHYAQHAGAKDDDDGGRKRIAHGAHGAGRDLVSGGYPLEGENGGQALHGVAQCLRVGGEDAEALHVEADYQHIEDRAAAHAEEEAAQVDGATARVEARAVVLRHKGHGGLHKGRDDEVAVDLEGDGGGRSGDGGGAELVDGTLDEDVGEGEDHALQAGGKAYLHNLAQLRAPHLHGTQVEADVAFLVGQNPYYTAGRHKVGADGGDGHAVHAHIAHQHKEEVEDDVHHAADAQPVEGPFGVAGRPQDGVAEVVDHHRGEAQSVDAQVLGGVVEDVGGGVERLKDGACHRHSQHQQGKAADEGDKSRRGHGAPDVAAVALAYARCDDDVGAHRYADE